MSRSKINRRTFVASTMGVVVRPWLSDPWKRASPKPYTAPSAATTQYPRPVGVGANATNGRWAGSVTDPSAIAAPNGCTVPSSLSSQYPRPDRVGARSTTGREDDP